MVYTPNQVNDLITNAFKRPATDFELQDYKTASPQTMATLPETAAKLNPNSIVDYLISTGQDSSLQARQALGQKYGITNVGTVEGNTALLKALRDGTVASSPEPVEGSIITPTETVLSTGAVLNQDGTVKIDVNGNEVSGSVEKAAQPPEEKAPIIPEVATNKEAYVTAQRAVLGVTKRLDEINKAIDSALANKRDEVARAGGVIDESQLRSLVLAENAPLLAERKDLLSQRSQLVGEQNIAGKAYQDSLNTQRQADANFIKQQQLKQGQEKIKVQKEQFDVRTEQANEKMRIQQEQFNQKLIQSGYKKVNDYADGTKVGEHFINLSGQAVKVNPTTGAETVIGSGRPVGTSGSQFSSNVKGNTTYTDFAKVPDAPNDQNRNTIYGTTGKTYGAIYEDAVTYAQTGKYQKVGMGSKPSSKAYDDAVKAKAHNIAASLGMTEDALRVAYKANSAAVTKLIQTKSNIGAFENRAVAQIDMILNGYKDPVSGKQVASLNESVPRSQYPIVNKFLVQGKILAGDTPAQLLSNSLITFATEYAKIMSGSTGSSVASSDSARREAMSLISTALSQGTLPEVLGLLQKEMETTTEGYDKQIQQTMGGFVGSNTRPVTPVTGGLEKENVTYSLQSRTGKDGYVSPDDWKKMKDLWISHDGTAEEFDKQFGGFKNPTNPNYK
jgi:hypothetical protein